MRAFGENRAAWDFLTDHARDTVLIWLGVFAVTAVLVGLAAVLRP